MANMLGAEPISANIFKGSAHIAFTYVLLAEAIYTAKSHWLPLMGGSAKSYGKESIKHYSLAKGSEELETILVLDARVWVIVLPK